MGLDYVDIFYSHRFDPDTPLEETMGALDTAVRQGKALYAGISSYSAEKTREAAAIMRGLGTPILIHQPSYSMLNRWIETEGLLDALGERGDRLHRLLAARPGDALRPLPRRQGPEGLAREPEGTRSRPDLLTEETLGRLRALNEIAEARGQTLAQMALAWTLRDPRVTSTLVGASSVAQLEENLAALDSLAFTADRSWPRSTSTPDDAGINLWAESSAT